MSLEDLVEKRNKTSQRWVSVKLTPELRKYITERCLELSCTTSSYVRALITQDQNETK